MKGVERRQMSSSSTSTSTNTMNHEDTHMGNKSQSTMTRLVDYFVVVGYTTDKKRVGAGCGITLQRFPSKDWDDTPFNPAIELFCQPQGWSLSNIRQEPKFFMSVLTDVDASRRYCACLSFHEPISVSPSKPADEEEENEGSLMPESLIPASYGPSSSRSSSVFHTMYAPKVLVLMSRHYQPDAFRHCLGTVYTVHTESMGIPLETLVGNLLGHVQVPPCGGPAIRFSIGGGDRQALQPPLTSTIPVTNFCVAQLFQQLGISNMIVLFCAVMTEQKILFHSKSRTRLTDACHALTSLMFPFRYCHVYIPMLPSSITEVASSPTPYIIGILSEARYSLPEMVDVIVVDLDGGSIMVPEGVTIPMLPDSLWHTIQDQLSMVLHPELISADFAFPPLVVKSSSQTQLDKEIRAIFMRMLAQMFQGYRTCLVIIRIHPKPFITFHKAKFLGERGLTECDFVVRLLNCMFFNEFIAERGAPYRPNDLWDDLYCSLLDQLKAEMQDPKMAMIFILELATLLAQNENPNSQNYVPKIIKPPEGAHTRTHVQIFPALNDAVIQDIIDEGMTKQALTRFNNISKHSQPRIVPMGPKITELLVQQRQMIDNSARRLEVLRNCINYIFENKISDARKSIHAVIRALKSHTAKLVLCQELGHHVSGNKAMLETSQFDMVVKLMHYALQGNSVMDEHGIAGALLPLATSFCRKLCTGVIQFAFTCIQDHPVWKNQQFWETSFYSDVQKDIKSLYAPANGNYMFNNNYPVISNFERGKELSTSGIRQTEFTALEISAEQMRLAPTLDPEKTRELVNSEESTLYSQAIHYTYRMVYMLVPLDTPAKRHREPHHHHHHHHHHHGDDERSSNIISVAESDSLGGESGFEEQDPIIGDTGTSVVRFVSRFVDKVCTEGGVTDDHIRALHAMIPGVVDMHVETLESVFRESKRLPAVQKPKIPTPPLLHGEELVMDSLRVYLLPDGRDSNSSTIAGTFFLPAEGALFFTNYRIIFKGTPCDPMACEETIIRSFPISSLTKEKRITVQYLAHLDQLIQDGLQLRSATFQLMKLAFDEEVTSESVDVFRKLLNKLRHPTDIFSYFSFAGHSVATPAPINVHKDKNQTLKGFAKKAVMMTAKKAGLKPKPSKRQKYVLRSWAQGNGGTLPANTKYMGSPTKVPPFKDMDGDDVSLGSVGSGISEEHYVSDEDTPHALQGHISNQANDAKSMERIMERAYYKDYRRLGLNTPTRRAGDSSAASILSKIDSFRISSINLSYMVCRSYPALVVVPALTSDETLKRISKCYRGGRFPVVTWRHPRTKALIVRGASFNSKGVMGILRGQGGTGGSGGDASTHLEQENFLRAIVNSTPLAVLRPDSAWALSGSNLSLDSLLTTTSSVASGLHTHESHSHLTPTQATPDTGRRPSANPFMKAMDTLRYAGTSGGKGMKNYKHWTAARPKKPIPLPPQGSGFKPPTINEIETTPIDGTIRPQKAALYVFGEKSQIKGLKTDTHSKIEYIPVDVTEVRQTRTAFKKLMRACLPSNSMADDKTILMNVESSDWLQQISHLMQLSGAVVDLVDVQGSSVMLCLEDGSDVTTQITSLAQLCLDPFYRTLDGFHTLLEKEWLGFGHRFSHRNSMTGIEGPSSNPGFAPIFLQFLDVVHQIHKQFPLAFEFNQYYIQFLAYHSVSARFRTFLVDNEFERVELGFMAVDDKRGSLPRHYKGVDTGSDDDSIYMINKGCSNSHQHHLGQSLFEYIEKLHAKSPIFFNFSYDKDCEIKILRPMSNLANLDIWEYCMCESLRCGASYDLETIHTDQHSEEDHSSDVQKDPRRAVYDGIDVLDNHIPDVFSHRLSELNRLEVEMGLLPQKWKQIYDKLEATTSQDDHTLTRQTSMSTQLVRNLGRSLHKRSTVDILVRGKMVRSTDLTSIYTHNHRFEKHTFTTLANCDVCSAILLGKAGLRCFECSAKCHEKCVDGVAKCQGKFGKGPPESIHSSNTPISASSSQVISANKSSASLAVQSSPPNYYNQFHSTIAENRTHEGYLYKRGALLKGWKQRWFVLDSIKHQLRYYDAMEDSHSKGFIDLSEVINITLASPTPGSPKKACDKSFFDIRTVRRSYNFCASDAMLAQEWIEKIQACL